MTSNSGTPPGAATSEPAPPGSAPPTADERVRKTSGLARLLSRPEFGAMVGAGLVWLFFAIVAYEGQQ